MKNGTSILYHFITEGFTLSLGIWFEVKIHFLELIYLSVLSRLQVYLDNMLLQEILYSHLQNTFSEYKNKHYSIYHDVHFAGSRISERRQWLQ
jgi:hypothetical protein